MRRVLPVLLLILTTPLLAADWSLAIKDIDKRVPRLQAMKAGDQHPGVCSSVVLNTSPGYALTAAHCIPDGEEKDVSITVNERHATLVKANRILDLAVVKFDVRGEQAVPLAPETPLPGSEVAVAGYAFGIEKAAFQFGHVSQALNRETKLLWLNLDLIFGDSGGAVLDPQGRLVGMSTGLIYQGPAHIALAVPVEAIKDFADDYVAKVK